MLVGCFLSLCFAQAQTEQDTSSSKKTQKEKEKGEQKVKEKAKKASSPAAVPTSTDNPPEIMEVNTFILCGTDTLYLRHFLS